MPISSSKFTTRSSGFSANNRGRREVADSRKALPTTRHGSRDQSHALIQQHVQDKGKELGTHSVSEREDAVSA